MSRPAERFVLLHGSSLLWILNAEALFSDGYCNTCGRPQGSRTTLRAEVRHQDQRSVGGYGGVAAVEAQRDHPDRAFAHRATLKLFAEPFLAGLAEAERDSLRWRPVELAGRAQYPLFELVGSTCHLPLARLRDDRQPTASCARCGYVPAPYYFRRDYMPAWMDARGFSSADPFYRRPDGFLDHRVLAEPRPPVFTTGTWHGHPMGPVLPAARWGQLAKGRRGLGNCVLPSPVESVEPDLVA